MEVMSPIDLVTKAVIFVRTQNLRGNGVMYVATLSLSCLYSVVCLSVKLLV